MHELIKTEMQGAHYREKYFEHQVFLDNGISIEHINKLRSLLKEPIIDVVTSSFIKTIHFLHKNSDFVKDIKYSIFFS